MAITLSEEARRGEFALFCERLGGQIEEENGAVRCIISLDNVRTEHNKFFGVKKGELSNVAQVAIVDEKTLKKDQPKIKKKYQFTTTMGNPDPDHLNWFAVLEEIYDGEDALTIVQRRRF